MAASPRLKTRVSTKGQVILPKPIRDVRNWPAGTELVVENTEAGVLLRAAPAFGAASLDQVFGRLRRPGRALTIEEMDAALDAEARRRAGD